MSDYIYDLKVTGYRIPCERLVSDIVMLKPQAWPMEHWASALPINGHSGI
jgi:hypothetical protein